MVSPIDSDAAIFYRSAANLDTAATQPRCDRVP